MVGLRASLEGSLVISAIWLETLIRSCSLRRNGICWSRLQKALGT